MSSTLLFKFNSFHDISESGGDLTPDEYSDITSKEGEWKVMIKPNGGLLRLYVDAQAQDRVGNMWGLSMLVGFFKNRFNEVNPNVDDYQYILRPYKTYPNKSKEAESLGYSIKSCVTLIARDETGSIVKKRKFATNADGDLKPLNETEEESSNGVRFLDGPTARSILVDNALIIELEVEDDIIDISSFNLPASTLQKNALELFDSGEDADVFFQVNGISLPAHKLIFKLNAKQLYSFFTSDDTTVIIEGTTPELFKFMLRYVYGNDQPDFKYLVEYYQEIIDITDKYNIIGLKLAAQAAKVASLTIDKDNVTEILIFAHDKNCFLLKEYAMKMYILNFEDLVHTDSFNKLATNVELLRELMIAVNGLSSETDSTVNKLIGKMLKYDLDFDGPKDVLLSRLKQHKEEE